MKYKKGDRVRIVDKWADDGSCDNNTRGLLDKWIGKVVKNGNFSASANGYNMVEDDGLLTCNCACNAGLAKTEPLKIVVTSDGKTTTAKLYGDKGIVKAATSKCAPSDTYDFATGARIAIDRLLGKPEQPLYKLEDIKAGDLLVVETSDGDKLNMTVTGSSVGLCCICPGVAWFALRDFNEHLIFAGHEIIAVYGPTRPRFALYNRVEDRKLLWQREP